MMTRRDMLKAAAAAAWLAGGAALNRVAAQQRLGENDLLRFDSLGQVTLLHFADIHAQLLPLYFREPEFNLGVGATRGLPPHLTGGDFLTHFAIAAGSADAYALAHSDFAALAKAYGRLGGLDRMATLVKAIRAARPGRVLLLDGGDTWQGSYTSLSSGGTDMVEAMHALGVDAMTGHWEFTYGAERVKKLVESLKFPFLAGNIRDNEWEEDVFKAAETFERGGVKIAVIGQAFPYTPVANPRYLIPKWTFGIQEEQLQKRVAAARAGGARLVVLLSHNGFDVDRKLAARVAGIDVILTAHTHDALPAPVTVGTTLLIASGSHGKFLSRLDLDVQSGRVADYRYRLIPIFSDAIRADPEMTAVIENIRAPHRRLLTKVLGRTESMLYRRGNFNGTIDDLICAALLEERDAEIALSPGFRWGATLLPGAEITLEDVYSQTAITYPNAYRTEMSGAFLRDVLEDVADNLFNPDPYYQQGGDMVRCGGLSYAIDIAQPIGKRIGDMTVLRTGKPIEADRKYIVAGWASVTEGTQGPPVWDVVSSYIERWKTIRVAPNPHIKVSGF